MEVSHHPAAMPPITDDMCLTASLATDADIAIAIDRGGTFCDVIAQVGGREDIIFKLLSEDPRNYPDAPTEAIRRVLEAVEGRSIPVGEKLDGSRISSCRIGTTVATNALLEHKGEKFAFITTKGFADVCIIGDQTRPKLFALRVEKPGALHDTVVEIDERITVEDYDLNPRPMDKAADLSHDPALVKTASGEVVRVVKPLDETEVRTKLQRLRDAGYTSLAVAFVHAYLYPAHEQAVERIARELGFVYVSTSTAVSPAIKYLRRSTAVCSEAYLCPVVRRYIEGFESGFAALPQRVEFMCSDGGLKQAPRFRGNDALLSGPAGGVVGIAASCFDADGERTPLIGFDMGGTSTDVSRYDGRYDYLSESRIADRAIAVPMLNIQTVAAGGGSILFVRSGLLVVGPESAGAYPGPACYRNGGPLTVTDANLFLGRLDLASFPAIFGPGADQPLDTDVVAAKFAGMAAVFNAETGQNLSAEEVAQGFLSVANETMSRPIRNATEARGYAPENHNLVSFGGAGGQHACAIAGKLGIDRILVHKWSSLLSAYGIAQAQLQHDASEPYAGHWSNGKGDVLPQLRARLGVMRDAVRDALVAQGAAADALQFEESLSLRYFGTDTTLAIARPDDEDYGAAFIRDHRREFAFSLSREIVIDALHVRGTGTASAAPQTAAATLCALALAQAKAAPVAAAADQGRQQRVFVNDAWHDAPLHRLAKTPRGSYVDGPALLLDATQTIFVEPGYRAYSLPQHVVIEREGRGQKEEPALVDEPPAFSHVQLSVFAHRFMSIAEQMGNTLQRTAISTSIRERLDFSCAVFSPDGALIANAPHIPIHLGSMQMAIQAQHRHWRGRLQDGDVLLTNHPEWGGTHLPDLTVVTPCFLDDGQIAFYTASRGHHTDIGGRGISAMMPESKELWEEGLNVPTMKIVSGGVFLEAEVRAAFDRAGAFPGCSPTRRIQDNLSDLKAQTSANQRGITLLRRLCSEFGLPTVHTYMRGIQANAEAAVRGFLKTLARKHPGGLEAEDYYDSGTVLKVHIALDAAAGSATFDFAGTGPQSWGNMNCPVSITHSAVIYVLRCLIDLDIPLNQGCLAPVEILIPKGCVLNPMPSVAVCGSTLASQRVIDLLLRAFHCVAASQGCASATGWGTGGRDPDTGRLEPGWNYGESIGGGSGAGPGWHGASAVHVHSTNTRMTDVEVVEKRTPVLVRQYAVRHGSGGRGRWSGGDGITREIEARMPLKCSIISERRVFRPYGVDGGEAGHCGRNYLIKKRPRGAGGSEGEHEEDWISLGSQAVLKLQPGERLQINTPGGGAWGEEDKSIPASEHLQTSSSGSA